MRDGRAKVFCRDGRQLRRGRRPTPQATDAALERLRLTVHVSTKLNRSHTVAGDGVAHPAVPRPHRARPAGRRRAVRHRRGLDGHGARLHAACSHRRRRDLLQRGRDRHAARPVPCSATPARAVGRRSKATTTASASTSRGSCPASTTSTPRSAAGRLLAAPRTARRAARSPRQVGRAHFTVNALDVLDGPGPGRLLLQTIAVARPVQHHDLRPRRPLPRHPQRPPRGVRQPRRPRRRSASRDGDIVDLVSVWTDGAERRAPRTSGSSPTRPPGAARPPTSPRPTCWCRSTARPTPAIRRHQSR